MRNNAPRGGIERKILSSILSVGVIPMALALVTGYTFAHQAQRVAVQQNLATAAQKTAEGLLLALNARLRKVGTLSRGAELSEALRPAAAGEQGNLERVKKRLETEAKNASDGPAVLSLYDIRGNLVVSTEHEPSEKQQYLPILQRAIGLPRFVTFEYKPSEFRYVARIVAPVHGTDGRIPVGYISETQGVNSLMRFVTAREDERTPGRVGEDAYQVIYGVPGLLFVSDFDEDQDFEVPLTEREPADLRLAERIRNAPDRTGGSFRLSDYITRDGEQDVLLAYHRLFDWGEAYILVYRPAAVVYANINRGALLAFLASALVIATFCLLAYRHVHNKIVRPLALLSEGAQIVQRGDLDLKLDVDTGDEIEELALSFNEMARALNENIHQLEVSLKEVTRAREKLREANEELKTLDEMKTNLLSNVSHELRTPLVSVMGYTDMILNEKAGPITQSQREYLGISLRNVEKLVTLIENLLDFSRLHRGAEELVFDTFDLIDCAHMGMQIVQPVAEAREIDIELIAPEEPVLVEGDKGKIGQVFNNLLSNAVKFNQNGGEVTIELRPGESDVEVSVADTGIGIPADRLDRIFTRFYQVDDSSTRKYGGTGIGLAISQDIVRLHGSRITVTSKLNEGSVFRFSLPLHSPRKVMHKAAVDRPELGAETRLLIELVTKDRALTIQMRNLLVPEGMDLVHALQPASALSLVHKYRPDCIFVNVEEDTDECDVLDLLLTDELAKDTPIVVMTNNNALYERYRARVAARLKRGFRKSTLLSSIRYALGREIVEGETLGTKVLCVDDDEEVLTFMRRCLEAERYEVECCSTGVEALERAKKRDYGLILLDIAMPGLDGLETCRRIRLDASLAGIRVYLITAKPIDGSVPGFQNCGADGCLLKPFKHEDLLALLEGYETRGAAEAS